MLAIGADTVAGPYSESTVFGCVLRNPTGHVRVVQSGCSRELGSHVSNSEHIQKLSK